MHPAIATETDSSPQPWPLMQGNIAREDLNALIRFLSGDPILTHSRQVEAFEEEWSQWLGRKYSVFVNSGASANLITLAALRELHGGGELVVPTLTWVSDIASALQCGFRPRFVDIDPRTLGMAEHAALSAVSSRTRAVFLTHVLGYNALTARLLKELQGRAIPLIEDACESYGAAFQGRKVGTFGLASNFSFYYAHHMTTVEGGMISTDDEDFYEAARMLRSHGMARECRSAQRRRAIAVEHPDLHPDFIFTLPGFNMRPTEMQAVLGREQLKRLDFNNARRTRNLHIFLNNLDPELYRTDFQVEGSCSYAFTLILNRPDDALRDRVMDLLRELRVEFRRGTAGGGNQLRQPYLKGRISAENPAAYPEVDHVHFYGFYIGNYPDLPAERIEWLCEQLNGLGASR